LTFTTRPRSYDSSLRETPRETSIDILKRRYARGEISKEEFEQMKKDLER
jgi:putative membrane protein